MTKAVYKKNQQKKEGIWGGGVFWGGGLEIPSTSNPDLKWLYRFNQTGELPGHN